MIESIPLWGSVSIVSVLVGIIVTGLLLFVRGEIVSRKQLDQVQKIADTFQKAWEIEKETNQGQADALQRLTAGQDTMLRILEALPPRKGGD